MKLTASTLYKMTIGKMRSDVILALCLVLAVNFVMKLMNMKRIPQTQLKKTRKRYQVQELNGILTQLPLIRKSKVP